MKKRNIALFALTVLLGTALHFVYGWSGESAPAGLFCPVNESVWEHLKALVMPFLLLSAAERTLCGEKAENLFAAKALALWAGLFCIVAGYYTYTGVFGKDVVAVDVALFVAGSAAAWLCSHRLLEKGRFSSKRANALGMAAIALTALAFFWFTFAPPGIPLFRDPQTGQYGIGMR